LKWILKFFFFSKSNKGLIFALAGGYQMLVWAKGKHRNYRKEFEKYPRERKAMIPFFA
jgi:very-long-chain enoyl-CoA reductase